MFAAAELANDGLDRGGEAFHVEIIDARFCKPVDAEMLSRVLRPRHPVLTVEDHSLQNGFGSAVIDYAVAHGLPTTHVTPLGMPDRLIAHATRKQQLAEVGLDPAGIAQSIRDAIRKVQTIPSEIAKPTVEVSVRNARTKTALAGQEG